MEHVETWNFVKQISWKYQPAGTLFSIYLEILIYSRSSEICSFAKLAEISRLSVGSTLIISIIRITTYNILKHRGHHHFFMSMS
jgi:hypothetical protein